MENYSSSWEQQMMKMAVEMAAVSMEKPSGALPAGAGTETLSPDLGFAMAAARKGHHRDPLSPQLFVLAVDVLGRLVRRATHVGILQELHPRRRVPKISLYADDVVLFCHLTHADTAAVKEILLLFGRASGLQVNYNKSAAALINDEDTDTAIVTAGLGCPIVNWATDGRPK
ncbi:hypothetical protein QYE76_006359 [Lolium multiflorum]|uniref:Reverse transcriptase domain-containing protein n=1 Tax=Lolium multiflorum TaxID=4521 RepID=A0AAD8W376_LOLMU|nr:hypothetical protein QYE76_006359 [Lolium multiflorum]